MKKIIFASILCLTACGKDDRVRCEDLDGGSPDAGCVETEFVAFPDLLIKVKR